VTGTQLKAACHFAAPEAPRLGADP
jgi:hypothetical protein